MIVFLIDNMNSCIENDDGLLFASFHEVLSDVAFCLHEHARSDIDLYSTVLLNLNRYYLFLVGELKLGEV